MQRGVFRKNFTPVILLESRNCLKYEGTESKNINVFSAKKKTFHKLVQTSIVKLKIISRTSSGIYC